MKPFYLRFTLLFYLVLNLFLVKAQKPRLVFHQITPKEGLSESTIRGIVEDARGFMWFASEDGLNKFDGYKFTVYKNLVSDTFSISNNSNKSLLNDSKGNLWIVTKNGLNIYDHIHDRFYNYRSPEHKGLHPLKSDIEAIAEDCKGHIWVAAGIAGLYEIENLHKSPHNYPFQSTDNSNIFISVMPYSDGTILVGTRDGLLKFDTNKKEYIDLRNLYGRGYHVRSIYIDKNNNIWLCTTQGLKIIDNVTGRRIHAPPRRHLQYKR